MSDAASKLAPTGRLRVAVYAVDLLRRTASDEAKICLSPDAVGTEEPGNFSESMR